MAAVLEANEQFIRNSVRQGMSHGEISARLQALHPGTRGLSSRTVRRFCRDNEITRMTNPELDEVIAHQIRLYGHSYGRRMMQGSVRYLTGATASQRRVAQSLQRIAPDAYRARSHDMLLRTNPVPYFAPYFGHKGHFDQNEKLARPFGCTEVALIDGCSRYICGLITLPVKNPILIYEFLFRPALIQFGIFDQIRMDHGTEFFLCIFVQELLAHHRNDQHRAPWCQTRSVNNTRAERMWPEENQRANYPIKRVLTQMQRRGLFDFEDPITKFCVSWVVMHVCHESSQNLVNSWNYHRIPGRGGCVPVEKMEETRRTAVIAEELIPTTAEAVQMYEARGGRLTRNSTSGFDPLVHRQDLLQSREHLFKCRISSFSNIFSDVVHGQGSSLEAAIRLFIRLTHQLNQN